MSDWANGRLRPVTSYDTLAGLVRDPDSGGAGLFAAAVELRDGFVRGEHMIGLLPPDAPEVLADGLRRRGCRRRQPDAMGLSR